VYTNLNKSPLFIVLDATTQDKRFLFGGKRPCFAPPYFVVSRSVKRTQTVLCVATQLIYLSLNRRGVCCRLFNKKPQKRFGRCCWQHIAPCSFQTSWQWGGVAVLSSDRLVNNWRGLLFKSYYGP